MAEDFVAGFTGQVRKESIDIGDDGGELEIDYSQPVIRYSINGEQVGEGHAYAWIYRFHARRPETALRCGCNACLAHLARRGPLPDVPPAPEAEDSAWSDFLDGRIRYWRRGSVPDQSLLTYMHMTSQDWACWVISNRVPLWVREAW